jgi:hypothetical protein
MTLTLNSANSLCFDQLFTFLRDAIANPYKIRKISNATYSHPSQLIKALVEKEPRNTRNKAESDP